MKPHHGNSRGRGGKRSFGSRNNNNGGTSFQKYQRPTNTIKEGDVGITEFISSTTPFNGVIKAKFSDFQVHEIDLEGNVVSLTDQTVPTPPLDAQTAQILNDPDLDGLITTEQWEKIKTMVEKKNKGDSVLIDVTEMSKEARTQVHVLVKNRFGQSLASSTVEENGRKYIKCSVFNKKGVSDVRTKWTWPHAYTYFVVHKYNLDTMKACSDLALSLKVKPSALAYAGTKDKRANTSQLFCIKKRHPNNIAFAANKVSNLYVGDFTFKPNTLKLGDLRGNRFKIALRNITADKETVEESLNSIKEHGFINYYGLQRFGNSAEVPTFAIGKALLLGKWNEAIELIMKPREGEPEFMQKMREHWWKNRDAKAARSMLHKSNNCIESKLLHGMIAHDGNDFINALENIPRNARLLYMHAYQSLLWNKAVSKRVKLGLKPILGDLVFVDKNNGTAGREAIDEVDNDEEDGQKNDDEGKEKIDYKALVKPLTKKDINAGNYTIFDVVMPLPGYDITYPSNEIGQYFTEMLQEDGLSSLKRQNKTYSLTGAYRKMVEMPGDMTWKFVKYNSDSDMLLNTDFELLKKNRLITLPEEGPLTACLLEFSLSSSTYATMAIREILKIDTSTDHHVLLAQGEKSSAADAAEKEPAGKKAKVDEEEEEDQE